MVWKQNTLVVQKQVSKIFLMNIFRAHGIASYFANGALLINEYFFGTPGKYFCLLPLRILYQIIFTKNHLCSFSVIFITKSTLEDYFYQSWKPSKWMLEKFMRDKRVAALMLVRRSPIETVGYLLLSPPTLIHFLSRIWCYNKHAVKTSHNITI